MLENFGIQVCMPYKELILLDHHSRPSFVGASFSIVCLLHICLVCGLALCRLTILLSLFNCPALGLWPRGADSSRAVANDWFVFVPVWRAVPRPQLFLPHLFRPPRPLDWFGIWSMKEFCNFNCDFNDGFAKFFHWLDEHTESYGMSSKVTGNLSSFQSLNNTSSHVAFELPWRLDLDNQRCWRSSIGILDLLEP